MRQVFASQRIENVEAVAQLLRDAGIEVQVQNGRGWRGAIRGNFSYRATAEQKPKPSVWVVRSDDQTRARQLLREHGLWQSDSLPGSSFINPTMHGGKPKAATGVDVPRTPKKIRAGLLVTIGLVGIAAWVGFNKLPKPAPATEPSGVAIAPRAAPSAGMTAVVEASTHVIATPPALAELLLRQALTDDPSQRICASVDDADPDTATLQALQHDFPNLQPASACIAGTETDQTSTVLTIREYTTDGSGAGTVQRVVKNIGDDQPQLQTFNVQRTGVRWQALPAN